MENMQMKEKIKEHLLALELSGFNWLNGKDKILRWSLKIEKAFGDAFLLVELRNGITYEFSHIQSEGTEWCRCKKQDPNYNARYNCCGDKCDWMVPRVIRINQDTSKEVFVYRGKQRDLWIYNN